MVIPLDQFEPGPGDGSFQGLIHIPRERLVERVVGRVVLVERRVTGCGRTPGVVVHREEEVAIVMFKEVDPGVEFIGIR